MNRGAELREFSLSHWRAWFGRTFFFGPAGRMDALEGVRGLAILLVVVVHFFGHYSPDNYFLPAGSLLSRAVAVITVGHMGVDLFFILSAFLIFSSAARAGIERFDIRHFAIKRSHRIFPAHFIAIALWILLLRFNNRVALAGLVLLPLLYFVLSSRPRFPAWSRQVFFALFFLMPVTLITYALLEPPGTDWTINHSVAVVQKGLLEMSLASTFIDYDLNFNPSWSLSLELFFYLLVPALLALYAKLQARYLAIAGLLFALCVVVALVSPELSLRGPRFMAFAFGIGLIPLVRRMDTSGGLQSWLGRCGYLVLPGLLLCQYAFVSYFQYQPRSREFPFYLACDCVFALLVASALSGSGPMHRLCSWKPLRFLGNISFSLYITHAIIVAATRPYLHQETFAGMWLDAAVTLGMCVAVACYTFYFVEREYFRRDRHEPRR